MNLLSCAFGLRSEQEAKNSNSPSIPGKLRKESVAWSLNNGFKLASGIMPGELLGFFAATCDCEGMDLKQVKCSA